MHDNYSLQYGNFYDHFLHHTWQFSRQNMANLTQHHGKFIYFRMTNLDVRMQKLKSWHQIFNIYLDKWNVLFFSCQDIHGKFSKTYKWKRYIFIAAHLISRWVVVEFVTVLCLRSFKLFWDFSCPLRIHRPHSLAQTVDYYIREWHWNRFSFNKQRATQIHILRTSGDH